MSKIKTFSLFCMVMFTSPMAFAGGPVSHLPIKAQLKQESKTIKSILTTYKPDTNNEKLMIKVQRLDYALQNTANQMHVKYNFVEPVSHPRISNAELIKSVYRDSSWIKENDHE